MRWLSYPASHYSVDLQGTSYSMSIQFCFASDGGSPTSAQAGDCLCGLEQGRGRVPVLVRVGIIAWVGCAARQAGAGRLGGVRARRRSVW